jgi:predicted dehydrogenase
LDDLLSNPSVEGIILGGPLATRSERLRRVIQLGRHCLCLHPVDPSPLVYHELSMMAADRRVILMPWLLGRLHPALLELVKTCRSGSIGSLKLVTIERTDPPDIALRLEDRYAEAADLVSFIGGDVTEVSSMGDASAGRTVVHHRLTCGAAAEVRLQTAEVCSARWKITVATEGSQTELCFENGLDGPSQGRIVDGQGVQEIMHAAPGLASMVLAQFRQAVSGQPYSPSWCDATRAVELADWARYSLDRRRAVDVFREERGELASFKGRMTSLGCGLIWITLFMLIVIAAGKGLHWPGMDWLAIAVAVVWSLFLLFQALRWALPKDAG